MRTGPPGQTEKVSIGAGGDRLDYAIVGVRGSGEPFTGATYGMGPTVSRVARAAAARLPAHLHGELIGIEYPADTPWPRLPNRRGWSYPASVREGSRRLVEKVAEILERDPQAQIALLGLSQGAHVIGHAFGGGLDSILPVANAAAIVLFGDPARRPGHPYNVGDNRRTGVYHRMALGPGDLREAAVPAPFHPVTRSYCLSGDVICGFEWWELSRLNLPHLTYRWSDCARDAADLVSSQIQLRVLSRT